MAKKIRAALVGCGRIASLFASDPKRRGIVTHAQAQQAHPGVELVAACDRDAGRLADFSKRWGIRNTYTDFGQMLREQALEMVTIATPPESHYPLARAALEHGIKILFCEKPLAISLKEADHLVDLADRRKVLFAVNHSRRWDRSEQRIAREVRSGRLGKPQSVDAYYTGGIANSGSHLIDLLRMVTGDEVASVQAFPNALSLEADPSPDVYLKMRGGYPCFLHGLRTSAYLMFELDLYGEKGRFRITQSGFTAERWKASPHRQFSGYQQLLPVPSGFGKGYQNLLSNAVANLVKAAQGKEALFSTARDGRAALEVICAVHESLRRSGESIPLPIQNRHLGFARQGTA